MERADVWIARDAGVRAVERRVAGFELGVLPTTPAASRSSARNAGLERANGKKPAPTSCTKPGRVDSSLPSAPPGRRGFASSTSTRWPLLASVQAAVRPFGPEPITTTSGSFKPPAAYLRLASLSACRPAEASLTSAVPKKAKPRAPLVPLTGKQKSHLRALAHKLKPVVQIGRQGLTDAVLAALEVALERHELIKIKISGDAEVEARELGPKVEKATKSQVAQIIGHTLVVYRRRDKDPKIVLPRIKAAKAGQLVKAVKTREPEPSDDDDGGDDDDDDVGDDDEELE